MTELNGWWWHDYEQLGSTNDEAACLAAQPPAERFVVTAKCQTNGRGRRGRSWSSLEGNLFMSLGLQIELAKLGELVFVMSLSLLETIRQLRPDLTIKLKWPNDVLVEGAKISGILLEKAAGMYIITGIGVNVCAAPDPAGLIYPATSLAAHGIEIGRIAFLEKFLTRLNENLEIWTSDFEVILKRWLQNAKGLGEQITVSAANGDKKGIFRGVDENGFLLLEHSGVIEKIAAGDVFYL